MATAIPTNLAAFSAWEVAAATGGDLLRVPETVRVATGIVTDSRAVVPGSVFVALRGATFDGHTFLEAAVERGATTLVVERGHDAPSGDLGVVAVDDTTVAFGLLARAHLRRWRRRPDAGRRVAALTGSAGKTTTKDLLATILRAVDRCHATVGNLNNRVGVPSVALAVDGERFAVFELGMSEPGEIAALTTIVEPDVALLLNVGVAHAEGFGGSRGAIAREKGAIFEGLGPNGVAITNLDDVAASAQIHRTRARAVGFGRSEGADVRLIGRAAGATAGAAVTVERGGMRFDVPIAAPGEAAAMDLVAAIAAADAVVGQPVPGEVIAGAIAAWRPPAGRAVTIEVEGGVLVIDDTYNANPGSMRAAFEALVELRRNRGGRAIAVLGEMRELGPLSTHEHHALGEVLAHLGVDLVIGCGGAIDVTARRAEQGGVPVRLAPSAEEAGRIAAGEARAGDVVLFKGSRGAAVERALGAFTSRFHPLASRAQGLP